MDTLTELQGTTTFAEEKIGHLAVQIAFQINTSVCLRGPTILQIESRLRTLQRTHRRETEVSKGDSDQGPETAPDRGSDR